MKYAILLSGCGLGDGTQLEEAVLTYLALDQNEISYIPIAPDREQLDVINHFSEEACNEKRNILIESARIGKGKILPLSDVNVNDFDGLIIVGGMGVYKNLSDYYRSKTSFSVSTDVDSVLKEFFNSNKPIGSICAGVILVAKTMSNLLEELTVGTTCGVFEELFEYLNVEVIEIDSNDSYCDYKNKFVYTPAFLGTQSLVDVFEGINKMIKLMKSIRK